jgi:hypothetical protein
MAAWLQSLREEELAMGERLLRAGQRQAELGEGGDVTTHTDLIYTDNPCG